MLGNLCSDLIICTGSDTFKILPYSALCFFTYMPAYSIIFSVIEVYSRILRYYEGNFKLIQAYSAPGATLAYSQPCHIFSSSIFKTRGLFKILSNIDQTYSELCHSALFGRIQNLVQHLHTQKSGILEILDIQNPSIIAS